MNVDSSRFSKKKIGIAVLIIILLLINSIAAVFLYLDIQVLESPETTIEIEISEITAEQAVIISTLRVKNPNPYTLIMKDLKVSTNIPSGKEIVQVSFDGGEIKAGQTRTFTSTDAIHFDGTFPEELISTITGTVGATFFGVLQKTLPISLTVIISTNDILEDIDLPSIAVSVDYDEITQEGISLIGTLDITNPNSFDLAIDDIIMDMTSEQGDPIGSFTINGGSIKAKSSQSFTSSGMVSFSILDAGVLDVQISSEATIKVVGVEKSILFSTSASIHMPGFEDIFNLQAPTDAVIKTKSRATLRGFVSDLTLEISNPNALDLVAQNVTFSMYRIDNDVQQFLGESIADEHLLESETTTVITGQITIPYRTFFTFGKRFLPDALLITVRANVTLAGLEQPLWIGVGGVHDLHLLS